MTSETFAPVTRSTPDLAGLAKPPENRKLKGITQPGGLEAVQHTCTASPSTENDFDKLSPDSDLPQRPRATSPP